MIAADRERFFRALHAAAEVYGESLSDLKVETYWHRLLAYPIGSLEAAIQRLLVDPDRKFFPRPGEIVRAIEGDSEARAVLAWGRLYAALEAVGPYESVDFQDLALHQTVLFFGSWPAVAAWLELDEEALGFRRREFQKVYGVLLRTPAPHRIGYLPGIAEADRRMKGLLAAFPLEVVVVGPGGEPAGRKPLPAAPTPPALPPGAGETGQEALDDGPEPGDPGSVRASPGSPGGAPAGGGPPVADRVRSRARLGCVE